MNIYARKQNENSEISLNLNDEEMERLAQIRRGDVQLRGSSSGFGTAKAITCGTVENVPGIRVYPELMSAYFATARHGFCTK